MNRVEMCESARVYGEQMIYSLDPSPYLDCHNEFEVNRITFHVKPLNKHLLHACQRMFRKSVEFFPIEMVESDEGNATYLALAMSQKVYVRYNNGFQPINECKELKIAILKRFRIQNGSNSPKTWEVTFVLEDYSELPAFGTFDELKTLFSFTG
ncbi:uncharacterized protein N7484_008126 [Penicillium longicatenatum]|uniref:uncharacterized protein n=1 Tax=Penicillium longicatenatum TaxID=1561947 RepID=UPI0025492B93|nr:uncharacterized protein N7484_008126 [Penicillium longicatenatum]KAJ5640264.1 hypothetical protein N7484_008126 [Penicillium longicatenatum]